MLCVKFGWNWLSGSGEEDENVKSLRQRRRQRRQRQWQRRRKTDKFWSENLTWTFGSGELKSERQPAEFQMLAEYMFLVCTKYLDIIYTNAEFPNCHSMNISTILNSYSMSTKKEVQVDMLFLENQIYELYKIKDYMWCKKNQLLRLLWYWGILLIHVHVTFLNVSLWR